LIHFYKSFRQKWLVLAEGADLALPRQKPISIV